MSELGELPGLWECIQLANRYRPIAERIRTKDMKARWAALREFYEIVSPEILKYPANEWAIDPYAADWTSILTPIEFGMWCDIRQLGMVMYPQYPVGKFFVDFGNPVARVAIECDGAAFHKDAAKDQEREEIIRRLGWNVYRFTGRECLAPDEVVNEEGDFIPNLVRPRDELRVISESHGLGR